MDVHHPPTAVQVDDQLRERGEHLLEEDRDVLAGQPLDRLAVAIRSVRDRPAATEEVLHAAPVHRCDDGVDELPAEELGPLVIEQDLGNVPIDREAAILERGEVMRVGRPRPRRHRRRVGARLACQRVRRDAGLARSPDLREQPEIDTEVDEPGAMEAPEARDQVVETIVVAHSTDCRTGSPSEAGAGAEPARYRDDVQRFSGVTGSRP